MEKVYIVAARRTALGSFGGAFKGTPAPELGAAAIRAALEDCAIDPAKIDEVFVGNVLQGAQGMGPGRQASIAAGIPDTVPAHTMNMICCSGMKTVMLGAQSIRVGDNRLVVSAGMENMSRSPYNVSSDMRWGKKLGSMSLDDTLITDGLTDVFNNYHMGITAENIARKHNLTREQQDEFAVVSQKRADTAQKEGRFKAEIVPFTVKSRRKETVVDSDEYPKPETTVDSLSSLRPAFDREGTVTAGNASGINDGASAIILASESAVKEFNLTPLAEVVADAQAGVDPAYMGLGPVPAVSRLMKKTGMKLEDVDLFELNEAFAAQSLGVLKEMADEHGVSTEWLLERCNVNGGAIALGHPLGATGNRILVTLLYELKRQGKKTGVATLCAGGGMGTAVLLKLE
ncbi:MULTISPECIES: acetyl-CoA C-acetyltransferase [unclassified Oceanispirochaeta]|uniref:acetyl-CoA C-acetyltransferase n=1 Tax=unclassified Oceanispirochaeta TaxID=2635722 RepID=UPI000E099574|nr:MULTISPECIES: acetyl-CoA C-acetyltransferase [unclassified Oceanispirochaeta]MBF9018149.1 acetyl-CoA C-acetyltransferase [Oceanispirochaeta sp. M2]NPD74613.1 acetyl-CoA C-acetyltransferase [Oceanispirochaeta sp. M1]RDG29564.1 acetyl-CoA C-acetyltransferase [Oceanispirochaeta sp. M1]